jgi:hypothetical protein
MVITVWYRFINNSRDLKSAAQMSTGCHFPALKETRDEMMYQTSW